MIQPIRFKYCRKTVVLVMLLGIIFASCKKDSGLTTDNKAELQAKTAIEQSDATAAAHLIGFWKFDGNPNDASGRGNNGRIKRGHVYFGAGLPVLTSDRFGRPDKCYHFEMYVNLGNHCHYTTNNIQVYFSNGIINGISNWFCIPVDH